MFFRSKRYCRIGLFVVLSLCASSLQAQENSRELLVEAIEIASKQPDNTVDFYNLLGDFLWRYPDDPRTSDYLAKVESPLALVAYMVEGYLRQWELRPLDMLEVAKPITPEPSQRPPLLVKNEFESMAEFRDRLRAAQEEYAGYLSDQDVYRRQQIADYESVLARHEDAMQWEKAQRKEVMSFMRPRLVNSALALVLGQPMLEFAHYDSETETFYARMVSLNGSLERNVVISVPRQEAEEFSQGLSQVLPKVSLTWSESMQLHIDENVAMDYNGRLYSAQIVDYLEVPVVTQVRVDSPSLPVLVVKKSNKRAKGYMVYSPSE